MSEVPLKSSPPRTMRTPPAFFFVITLDTGPARPLRLEMSDANALDTSPLRIGRWHVASQTAAVVRIEFICDQSFIK